MKKLRKLFVPVFMAICAVLPITAHADTVDDICEEYGYKYRWTVEAKLDDTYDGTWLREISDNGRIRISFVLPETTMAREASRGVIVAEGAESVVIAVRNYNNGNNYTEYAAGAPLKQENGEWIVDEEFYDALLYNCLNVGVFATGDNKTENRFLAVYLGELEDGKTDITPIGLLDDGVSKMEDSELSLKEKSRYYIKYIGSKSPKRFSESGEMITATPVVREDRKAPAVDDTYFRDEDDDSNESTIIYAPEKEIPEFDVTFAETQNAVMGKTKYDGMDENLGYDYVVLNGKYLNTQFLQSIPAGKARLEAALPAELTEGVSSTGKVTVEVQRFEVYSTNTVDKDMVFKPMGNGAENSDEIIVTFKGDLGERTYYLDTWGEKSNDDGIYGVNYELCNIFKADEHMIIYEDSKRVPYEEGMGGLVDVNDENYIFVPIKDKQLLCVFSDSSYCGIKQMTLIFGENEYTFDMDDVVMDFDVEADLSDSVIGTKAARKRLSEIRAERDKNREVENVLEDGKASIKIEHITDEKATEEPEENEEAAPEKIRVELLGKFLDFADQIPIIENDRVLVPFRVIFEALEADVTWDGETKTVTATKGGITISLTIGENKITKNGEEIEIDVPARIINERTLVPIRVISESFENAVSWDGANRIVEIK